MGSSASRDFTEKTGLYDQVLDYAADSQYLATRLAPTADTKIVICDFGARDAAAARWTENLQRTIQNVILISIGGEVLPDDSAKTTEKYMKRVQSSLTTAQVNASGIRDAVIGLLGEKEYFTSAAKAWDEYKKTLPATGMRLIWGEGMQELGNGWEKLCRGEVGPEDGLVFDLRT